MRLALAAGRPEDVDYLAQVLSSHQLEQWLAFERLEGYSIGARGDWERSAGPAAMYAEAHRNAEKRSRPFSAAEFLPWMPRPKMTANTFRAWFAGRIRKKPKKESN